MVINAQSIPAKTPSHPARAEGFTLIELLVAVAVMAILTAIAVPSYQYYVKQASRSEARSILMQNAQTLENNYTTANRYDTVNSDGTGGAPSLFTQSPQTGTAKYNLTVAYGAAPAQTFTLSAAPTGMMTGDPCGTLTLIQTGQTGSAIDNATCWQR